MKKVADISAYLFIFFVSLLSAISILGVWDFFGGDVIWKSFQSIGLLAVVAIVILIADHLVDQRGATPVTPEIAGALPPAVADEAKVIFRGIRVFTATILILSFAVLTLFGIMAIWELFTASVLHKAISSMAIISFSALIIIITCLEREKNPLLFGKKLSGGVIALLVIVAWIAITALFSAIF